MLQFMGLQRVRYDFTAEPQRYHKLGLSLLEFNGVIITGSWEFGVVVKLKIGDIGKISKIFFFATSSFSVAFMPLPPCSNTVLSCVDTKPENTHSV